jgi:HD-GYP domain-containing protein (c-di-GMP phosphodiesterase class II)
MQLADEQLYGDEHARSTAARRQAHAVLLSVLREREPELDAHVRQVATLARRVGERLDPDANALDELTRAAQMHDIGRVAIPDGILRKPGPLDEDEWALMRRHTLLGERILSAAPALAGVAAIVRASHERWDGRGYPDGVGGEEVPLGARIVFVGDAHHAMTTERPYGRRRSPRAALEELRAQAGGQFDPRVVAAFAAVVGAQPPPAA